jgi:hypothetical protein
MKGGKKETNIITKRKKQKNKLVPGNVKSRFKYALVCKHVLPYMNACMFNKYTTKG